MKDRESRALLQKRTDQGLDLGVQIVLENIRDTDPADRLAVVKAADTPALALSVDTGHAHWTHWVDRAPPLDRFISSAGTRLGHVHLQDTDGWADRHWSLGLAQ